MATASTSQPAARGLASLVAAMEATHNTMLEAIQTLEHDGYQQSALYLRREHGIWPADHECSFDDTGECVCGSSL